jgi:hypothetical protein
MNIIFKKTEIFQRFSKA